MPPDVYVASLARKRMAAGALFRDGTGRVLLVDPVHRTPGTCRAERWRLRNPRRLPAAGKWPRELGLDRQAGRVLALDWVPSWQRRPEGLIVVYDGGVLAPAEDDAITVPDGELAGFAFVDPARVAERVTPLVGRLSQAARGQAERWPRRKATTRVTRGLMQDETQRLRESCGGPLEVRLPKFTEGAGEAA